MIRPLPNCLAAVLSVRTRMLAVGANPVACSRFATVASGKDGIAERGFMLIKEAL